MTTSGAPQDGGHPERKCPAADATVRRRRWNGDTGRRAARGAPQNAAPDRLPTNVTESAGSRHIAWSRLPAKAKAWRLAHSAWSVAQLACLGYIWKTAVTGRRDAMLWASVGFLLIEGGALVVGRGNCPVGPLQAEWGDPVPFFELFLPPRAAKAAIPALAIVSLAGIAAIALRPPGLVRQHR